MKTTISLGLGDRIAVLISCPPLIVLISGLILLTFTHNIDIHPRSNNFVLVLGSRCGNSELLKYMEQPCKFPSLPQIIVFY